MITQSVFVAHPSTVQQVNALKAVLKAINIQFEIKKVVIEDKDEEPTKKEIIKSIKKGFKELKLIQEGKLSTTSAQDFLNEL